MCTRVKSRHIVSKLENLRGLKFSLMGSLQSFCGLVFAVDGMQICQHATSTTVRIFSRNVNYICSSDWIHEKHEMHT